MWPYQTFYGPDLGGVLLALLQSTSTISATTASLSMHIVAKETESNNYVFKPFRFSLSASKHITSLWHIETRSCILSGAILIYISEIYPHREWETEKEWVREIGNRSQRGSLNWGGKNTVVLCSKYTDLREARWSFQKDDKSKNNVQHSLSKGLKSGIRW